MLSYQYKFTENDIIKFKEKLLEEMYDIFKKKYNYLLENKLITLLEVEQEIIYYQDYLPLFMKLMNLLTIWEKLYPIKVFRNELAILANDSQNVHTGSVNKQTRNSIQIMIATKVQTGQKTLDEIITSWVTELNIDTDIHKIYNDMRRWANKSWMIEKDDWLYRRALRGLWAKIKSYNNETRLELVKRLWEECNESLEKCAQGHLSRLANVLVGFDSEFKSPQSLKESLQDALAYISTLDITTEEKISKATIVMDDLQLPQEERQVWLEAF